MVANRYLGGRAGGAWEEFAPARRLAARAARLRAELDDGGAGLSERWRLVREGFGVRTYHRAEAGRLRLRLDAEAATDTDNFGTQ